MNTASQNLGTHLKILERKLTHRNDYELALNYFLEEFAGDLGFHKQGHKDDALHLELIIRTASAEIVGDSASVEEFTAFYLPEHAFFHGHAFVGKVPVIFFYFERVNAGLAAVLSRTSEMQVARFRIPDSVARNPGHN